VAGFDNSFRDIDLKRKIAALLKEREAIDARKKEIARNLKSLRVALSRYVPDT
jgi:hypothetical protein